MSAGESVFTGATFSMRRKFSASGFLPDGTDVYGAAVFDYADKQVALTYSKIAQDRCGSQILGDEGTLTIESLSKLTNIRLFTKNGTVETLAGETEKHVIMGYEAKAFYDFVTRPEFTKNAYRDVSALSMKTAAAIRERAGSAPIQRMAQMLVEQILEIMPELKDVTPWNAVGQRRTLDELGEAANRRLSLDALFDLLDT